MHEMSLISGLMNRIDAVAREHNAAHVSGVRVWLGALSHISADHFREHFLQGARGTRAEGARLVIDVSSDTSDPQAQDILLRSVDVDE